MTSKYKIRNTLKNLPFYSEEIKSFKKKNKEISNIRLLSELPVFYKEPKKPEKLANIELLKELPFQQKKPKRPERLTKQQILENVLPLYDSVGISLREYTHKYNAATYGVEVIDNKSLDDSLFLAKKSFNDLLRDLLEEKGGFKYNLGARITLKRWNNATNSYDIATISLKAKAITVINQRFNLNTAYKELKHKLDICAGEGSGWIVDKIEDIYINVANYTDDP